jgi:hypothetical protein
MTFVPTAAARLAATALLALGFTYCGAADVAQRAYAANAEFVFARLRYDSVGSNGKAWYHYRGRIWERWETDYPEGDENFAHRLAQLTSVVPAEHGLARRLTDPDLFDFPLLYLCWRDIPADHPILHTVFELDGTPQIPSHDFAVRGWKTDLAWKHRAPATKLTPVNFRGYFDEHDRLMVVATHNTDIGDGFEREAYGEWYFETYSTQAFQIGVNIAVYALTH